MHGPTGDAKPIKTQRTSTASSVQSQSNRMELALLRAYDAGRLKMPMLAVDFGSEGADSLLAEIGRLTALEVPHRMCDAIFRDSLYQGQPFRTAGPGERLNSAKPSNATAVFQLCPTALVFGFWDSTGPRGGLGAKVQRALVSEIVGYQITSDGKRTSSRIDPLQIENNVEIYRKGRDWTFDADRADKNKNEPVRIKPSEINHGNITPSFKNKEGKLNHGGVTMAYAEQQTVLSLAALRRLRFPVDGLSKPEADLAARTVLAASASRRSASWTKTGSICARAASSTASRASCNSSAGVKPRIFRSTPPARLRYWPRPQQKRSRSVCPGPKSRSFFSPRPTSASWWSRAVSAPWRPVRENSHARAARHIPHGAGLLRLFRRRRREGRTGVAASSIALILRVDGGMGDGGAEDELRPALEWLEQQDPPAILFDPHTTRRLVQAFVSVNDAETLPEDRPRKGRTFPSASLSDPDVYFIWDASPPNDVRTKLDRILLRTSSLGHSSSLVSVELAETVKPGRLTKWRPGASRGVRVRIPYSGRIHELVERHRRFEQSGAKIHRPGAGRTTLCAEPATSREGPIRGMFERLIVLKQVKTKESKGPSTGLRSTLSVTAALRGAVMKNAPQPVPEYISGHAPGSTPDAPLRSESPHLAFIPLANVGSRYSGGELLGVAVVLPSDFTREQREVCWRAVESVHELKMPWGSWNVEIADAEEERRTLLPETWTRSGILWSTVTPFVFDRYPKDLYGAEAEETVRQAFARFGLPEPCEIDLHYNPWHFGVPKAPAFPPAPACPGKPQRYHCHVRARFERPVAGPVIAGAGRFYGYGLFRALPENGGPK
ncbi:MAG TPA: type I-U CRISPR-associated protein Csb2 [Bryobacteraceae bacterium]|nr:type I-U CRISPR-associated protein Csb2 [Bryobacteraceae bacterium]